MASRPSLPRTRSTFVWIVFLAEGGGSSRHDASASEPTETAGGIGGSPAPPPACASIGRRSAHRLVPDDGRTGVPAARATGMRSACDRGGCHAAAHVDSPEFVKCSELRQLLGALAVGGFVLSERRSGACRWGQAWAKRCLLVSFFAFTFRVVGGQSPCDPANADAVRTGTTSRPCARTRASRTGTSYVVGSAVKLPGGTDRGQDVAKLTGAIAGCGAGTGLMVEVGILDASLRVSSTWHMDHHRRPRHRRRRRGSQVRTHRMTARPPARCGARSLRHPRRSTPASSPCGSTARSQRRPHVRSEIAISCAAPLTTAAPCRRARRRGAPRHAHRARSSRSPTCRHRWCRPAR